MYLNKDTPLLLCSLKSKCGKKNCPEAPFYQGAAGLKPKGMICDSKDSCFIVTLSVEIISYLHYTTLKFNLLRFSTFK